MGLSQHTKGFLFLSNVTLVDKRHQIITESNKVEYYLALTLVAYQAQIHNLLFFSWKVHFRTEKELLQYEENSQKERFTKGKCLAKHYLSINF